jgi:hypothetical protein
MKGISPKFNKFHGGEWGADLYISIFYKEILHFISARHTSFRRRVSVGLRRETSILYVISHLLCDAPKGLHNVLSCLCDVSPRSDGAYPVVMGRTQIFHDMSFGTSEVPESFSGTLEISPGTSKSARGVPENRAACLMIRA